MIATNRQQAVFQQQLMNWIEQLPPMYQERMIDVLGEYQQAALVKLLQKRDNRAIQTASSARIPCYFRPYGNRNEYLYSR